MNLSDEVLAVADALDEVSTKACRNSAALMTASARLRNVVGRMMQTEAALREILTDSNGKQAKGTPLEYDCPGCVRKQQLARYALGGVGR